MRYDIYNFNYIIKILTIKLFIINFCNIKYQINNQSEFSNKIEANKMQIKINTSNQNSILT